MAELWFWIWRTLAVANAVLFVVAVSAAAFGVPDAWVEAARTFGAGSIAALFGWPELQPSRRRAVSGQGEGA